MPTSRRNIIIRTVATITGDIAAGLAMASIASWVIQAASLGLFMGFLIWLLAAIASLAVSQYVVHPTLKVVLTDKKLDMAVDAVYGLANRLSLLTRSPAQAT